MLSLEYNLLESFCSLKVTWRWVLKSFVNLTRGWHFDVRCYTTYSSDPEKLHCEIGRKIHSVLSLTWGQDTAMNTRNSTTSMSSSVVGVVISVVDSLAYCIRTQFRMLQKNILVYHGLSSRCRYKSKLSINLNLIPYPGIPSILK